MEEGGEGAEREGGWMEGRWVGVEGLGSEWQVTIKYAVCVIHLLKGEKQIEWQRKRRYKYGENTVITIGFDRY